MIHILSPSHLSDIFKKLCLVSGELDTLGAGEALTGPNPLILQRGETSGKDSFPCE